MNDLAIKAKTDNYALEKIFLKMEPLCRSVANRYATWFIEFDDLMNYARKDVWYAVKKFEPGGKCFVNYCRMMVVNHMKSRVKRMYGKMRQLDREAGRLDRPYDNIDETQHDIIPSPYNLEAAVIRSELLSSIMPTVRSENLTETEYDCLRMFWFDEMQYMDIADELGVHRKTVDNALQRVKRKLSKNEALQEIYAGLKESAYVVAR